MMRMALVSVLMMSAPLSFAGNLFINGEKSDAAPRPKNALVRKGSTSMLPLAQADGRESRTWEIRSEDLNLANVFTRWAKDAGYHVRWDARKNSLVEGSDRFTGSFEDAVAYVLEGPGNTQSAYPLEVCFYPNVPPLARITRKGDQDKECK